jgi:hypothetical protein
VIEDGEQFRAGGGHRHRTAKTHDPATPETPRSDFNVRHYEKNYRSRGTVSTATMGDVLATMGSGPDPIDAAQVTGGATVKDDDPQKSGFRVRYGWEAMGVDGSRWESMGVDGMACRKPRGFDTVGCLL